MTTIGIIGGTSRLLTAHIQQRLAEAAHLTVTQSDDGTHDVYDELDMRQLVVHDDPLQSLDTRVVLPPVLDRDKFERAFRAIIDPNVMLTVERLVVVDDISDIEPLLAEFPDETFDFDDHVGAHWSNAGIILVNLNLLRHLATGDLMHGLWSTLVYEAGRALMANPLVDTTGYDHDKHPVDDVETYWRHIHDTPLPHHPDMNCVTFPPMTASLDTHR